MSGEENRREDFFTVETADGLVELPFETAKKLGYIKSEAEAPAHTPAAPVGGVEVKPLVTVDFNAPPHIQASQIGLRPSVSIKDRGPGVYSSYVQIDNALLLFICELDKAELEEYDRQGKALDDEMAELTRLALSPTEDDNITPEEYEARALANQEGYFKLSEWTIQTAGRGCPQLHPLTSEKIRDLYPTQKTSLREMILAKSVRGVNPANLVHR